MKSRPLYLCSDVRGVQGVDPHFGLKAPHGYFVHKLNVFAGVLSAHSQQSNPYASRLAVVTVQMQPNNDPPLSPAGGRIDNNNNSFCVSVRSPKSVGGPIPVQIL